jgi:hypothetical protein
LPLSLPEAPILTCPEQEMLPITSPSISIPEFETISPVISVPAITLFN